MTHCTVNLPCACVVDDRAAQAALEDARLHDLLVGPHPAREWKGIVDFCMHTEMERDSAILKRGEAEVALATKTLLLDEYRQRFVTLVTQATLAEARATQAEERATWLVQNLADVRLAKAADEGTGGAAVRRCEGTHPCGCTLIEGHDFDPETFLLRRDWSTVPVTPLTPPGSPGAAGAAGHLRPVRGDLP